jgi:type I restriction enzyme S subunit
MEKVKILETVKIINETVKKYEGTRGFLSTGDLDFTVIKSLEDVTYLEKPSRANQNVKKGDIILARMQGTVKVKIIDYEEEDIIVSTGFLVLRCNKDIENRYLFHYLKSNLFQSKKDKLCSGATQKAINNNKFAEIKIPLADLPTQQKITTILDKADELRQYNKQLKEKYDALMQSLFLDMFGDPVRNEKGWEICTFSQILSKIESGWSPVCENKPRVNDKEWAVLKLGSVSYGTYNPKENKKYEFDVPKTKQDCEVKKGDLLFTRKNTYHMVGTTVFVYETSPRLLLPDTVFRLLYRKEKTSPIFLYFLLNHKKFIKEIQSLASGTSGSMPNISKAKLLSKETILPPISLQNEFAERVQLIEIQKQQAQEALVKSEDLFQGLLQQSFKGELN